MLSKTVTNKILKMKKFIVVLIGFWIGIFGFFLVREAVKEAKNNPKETGNFFKLLIGTCLVAGALYFFVHQSSGTPGGEQEVREERARGEEVTWQREAYLKSTPKDEWKDIRYKEGIIRLSGQFLYSTKK